MRCQNRGESAHQQEPHASARAFRVGAAMTNDEPPKPPRALIETIKANLRFAAALRESPLLREMWEIDRLSRAAHEQAQHELSFEVAKTSKAAATPQTIPNQQSLEERIKAETEAEIEAVNAEAEKRNAAELELEEICESTAPAQATTEPPPAPNEAAPEEGLAREAERIKAETEAEIEAVNAEAEKRNEWWLNREKLSRQVPPRLRHRKIKVTQAYVYELAGQDKYKAKRRDPGKRSL
jgi:hypothetical protein